MSSASMKFTTNVLRTFVLATATPFTIYSIEPQKPNGQVEALAQQETLQPVNMSSAPAHSAGTLYYDTIVAFLDFLDGSGIPWTILGGFLIVVGILAVQALVSRLEWLYGRCVNDGDSAERRDEL